MLNQLFNDVFTSTAVKPLTMLEAIGIALVLGLVVAKVYQYKTVYSKSFVMSLGKCGKRDCCYGAGECHLRISHTD